MAELLQVIDTEGKADRGLVPTDLDDDDLRAMYKAMLRIRLVDERMGGLQRMGRIGFYGAATGEEASVIGSAYALEDSDWIFPALRQGGALLLRGWPLREYVAQCMGTGEDLSKGRQMPCHYSDRAFNVVSWSSCIGTQLPHAMGAALAAKLRGDDIVVVGYMGDGATSESDFHVSLNFAGVYKAPAVFVCQNNQWAISVPLKGQTASETIAQKAKAYGMPGVRVDGNDVLAVYRAMKEATERARRGEGPTLIECVTYRIMSHSTSDDASRYRDESEVEAWKGRDPIARFARFLEARDLWTQAWEDGLRAEVLAELDGAIRVNESTAPPALETLVEDVYSDVPWIQAEQLDELRSAKASAKELGYGAGEPAGSPSRGGGSVSSSAGGGASSGGH